jgi:hypothetical protein
MKTIICPCGKEIPISPSEVGRAKYCSKKCFYIYRKRPRGLSYRIVVKNKSWFQKGEKPWNIGIGKPYFDINTGYWKISVGNKDVRYHRYIMEQFLGRKLDKEEVVHHKDNNPHNNQINNLCLFKNKTEHMKHHWETTRKEKCSSQGAWAS